LRLIGSLLPGGWPEVMARNRSLALQARALLLEALGAIAPCPEQMLGSMASIPLPLPTSGSAAARLDCQGLHAWFRDRGVETWLYAQPRLLLRISAQLYNSIDQFEALARLLLEAVHGR
jgi:isopenicillin-N epimerase